MAEETLYRCPSHVAWAVEASGLLVIDRARGAVHALDAREHALWDLLCGGSSFERAVSALAAVLSVSRDEAERFARSRLEAWAAAGLVEPIQ